MFADAAVADGVLRDRASSPVPASSESTSRRTPATRICSLPPIGSSSERLRASEFHPDAWPAVVIRDPAEAAARLAAAAGDKYTYRALDDVHRPVWRGR